MIVVDASAVVTSQADDGKNGERVRSRLRGERPLTGDTKLAAAPGIHSPIEIL